MLTLDTTGREWIVDAGDGALPAGEIYIAPIEEKSNGKIFFETLAVEGKGVFSNVTVAVEYGRMTGSDCEEFNTFLKELPKGGAVVAELGIGMNHLFGGKNECPIHFDFVAEGTVK